MKKSTTLLILLVLSISAVFTSCKKEAPVLPPENAFVISALDSNSQKKFSDSYSNWIYASTDVAIWTTILKVGLAVPVTAYVKALQEKPRHVAGDKWLWEFSVPVLLSNYNIQLYGKFNDTKGVDWQMYVSQVGGVQDFLWFTGTQNAEGTQGKWILFKSPAANHQLLQIDWTRNIGENTGTIKYTNIEPESTENGGYISYGNNQAGDYNAFYKIYNKGKDNLTQIEYNTKLHNGRIYDYNVFQDSLWHCWDTQHLNISCNK